MEEEDGRIRIPDRHRGLHHGGEEDRHQGVHQDGDGEAQAIARIAAIAGAGAGVDLRVAQAMVGDGRYKVD